MTKPKHTEYGIVHVWYNRGLYCLDWAVDSSTTPMTIFTFPTRGEARKGARKLQNAADKHGDCTEAFNARPLVGDAP